MDIEYELRGIVFRWNVDKERANIRKHDGVTFRQAAQVFFDPFHVAGDATRDDEQRQFIIGYSLSQRLLLTVYTDRYERVRVISARPATRAERRAYEQE